MTACVIVSLEGTFATEGLLDTIDSQRDLYTMLSVGRMVVVSTNPDDQVVRDFLRKHHLRYDIILNKEPSQVLDTTSWKVTQVRNVRASGWPVSFYLDTEPEAVRRVYAEGTPAMLMIHRISRPLWLPDARQPQAWDDLVSFITAEEEHNAAPDTPRPKPWEQAVVP